MPGALPEVWKEMWSSRNGFVIDPLVLTTDTPGTPFDVMFQFAITYAPLASMPLTHAQPEGAPTGVKSASLEMTMGAIVAAWAREALAPNTPATSDMWRWWRTVLGVCGLVFVFQAAPAVAAWQIVPSPTPSGSNYGQLTGTVVTGASSAWAVGYARVGSNPYRALIERWNGMSWTIARSAPVTASDTTFLNGLAAGSAGDVWAVAATPPVPGTRRTV
jgi:hypothetical protein